MPVSSGGNGGTYVQLSSQRSEAEAQASLRNVQSRYGSLFGGNSLEIQRADLGQKGIYYRVKLPTGKVAWELMAPPLSRATTGGATW